MVARGNEASLQNLDDGSGRSARFVLTVLAVHRRLVALAVTERLFAIRPGALGVSAPGTGTWGHVDVEEAKQLDAMQYLNDHGVRYLTLVDSPFPHCVRLTFEGGAYDKARGQVVSRDVSTPTQPMVELTFELA